MGALPAGIVDLRVAAGGYTDPRRRGWCDGGYLAFDRDLKRWKGWEDTTPRAEGELAGVGWLEELGGATLAWETVALDIQLSEWRTGGGKFAVVRPPGDPSTTRLHQFDATPGLTWFAVRENMPADRAFCVSLYREATPARDEIVDESALPYYYTEIVFGGRYALRLPKWREAELWRRKGGVWTRVLQTTWRHSELYNDSHSSQEMFITILPLDGQVLLMASNYTDQAVVWTEDCPIPLPKRAAAVAVEGNGGAAYIGLHDVIFATGDDGRERAQGSAPTTTKAENRLDEWSLKGAAVKTY